MAETLATGHVVAEANQAGPSAESEPGLAHGDHGPEVTGAEATNAEATNAEATNAEATNAGAGDASHAASEQPDGVVTEDLLVREGDVAGDYLERLLDVIDYDGDIDLDVEGDRAVVSIDGGEDLEKLVGSRGVVLEALQELTRLAVQQQTGSRSRLMLDIAQWRSARRAELSELGRSTAQRVRDSGEPTRLQPMTPFERKIVHDAVASVDGVYSESEGEEPRRRVVVFRST